jgi:hypothetical protein
VRIQCCPTPGPCLPRTPLSRRLCIRHRELDPAGLEVIIGLLRSDDRHAGIKKNEQQHEAVHKAPKTIGTRISCPSTRTFVPRFLQTPPRGGGPCASLALHLHQVERRTFTSKLLNMLPGCLTSPPKVPNKARRKICHWLRSPLLITTMRTDSPALRHQSASAGSVCRTGENPKTAHRNESSAKARRTES